MGGRLGQGSRASRPGYSHTLPTNLKFVRWGGASGPAAHLERRAEDVAPYLLS